MKQFEYFCENSIIEKEFFNYVKDEKIEIISFDIFDTLVFRKDSTPIEIYKKVSKNSFIKNIFFTSENFVNQRVVAEREARIDSTFSEEISLEEIYSKLPLSKEEQKSAIKIELEEEKSNIYINEQIKKWLNSAVKAKKKVIFISDIYFTKKELQQLVFKKLNIKIEDKNIFVSSSFNLTKATGNLYNKVLEEFKVNGSNILHIGDNYYSDVQMASKMGFNTIHYGNDEYLNKLFYLESNLNKSVKYLKIKEQASILNPYKEEKEKFFFCLGSYLFAPLLWEFSFWLKKLARQKKLSQLNFIMREGALFKKCYELIDSTIDSNLIYASRKSTFLAALSESEIKSNNLNFFRYRGLDIKDICSLFELAITDEYLDENKYVLIENINQDKSLEKKLSEYFQENIEIIIKNIKKQKEIFKKYLEELNYDKNSAIIDFGGTGTILKTINKITKNAESFNVLFYSHEEGVQNMLGSNFFSFLESYKDKQTIDLIRRSHQLIEVLFNGNETTTLSYYEDSKVTPLRDKMSKEMLNNKDALNAFEKGIEAFFSVAKEYKIKSKTYKRTDLSNSIKRLISSPLFIEASYLGTLYYDKGIGQNFEKVIEDRAKRIIEEEGRGEYFYKYNSSLNFEISNIVWPQGELALFDKEYFENINKTVSKGINYESIEKIMKKIELYPQITEVNIYAAGVFFRELLPFLKDKGIKVRQVFDTRAKIKPFVFEGFEVKQLESRSMNSDEYIIIASAVFAKEIKESINSLLDVNIIDCF